MRVPVTLMMAIGRAALNVAGVGLVGDVAEIGKAAWNLWKKSPEERLDELEAVVGADDAEIVRAAQEVAAEVAADQPEEVRIRLASFLKQVRSRIQQSQRRPADPSGRTIRPGLVVDRPEDVTPFIPDQLPRFHPGEQPLASVDWVLVELLGMGGFGEVWKARHAHFDSIEPVALKFCTDPVARQRLLRHEARVLDRVMRQGRHPGIVRLKATYLRADPPCLEYEYISGGDLGGLIEDWHRQPEKPSPERIASAMLQLAEIVAFAHRLDPAIVHRDLKPANILVQETKGGEVAFKITDFGIGGIATARAIQASRVPTSPREFMTTGFRGSGTLLYASDEQLNGNDPDPRDDIHALGVIWYQMLTGDLTKRRPGGTAWRRRFLERGMSAGQIELLESCFEDQEDRPADATVMAEKLAVLLERKAPPPPPPPPPPKDEIVNSIGMKLKLIPAGEFMMGSDATDPDAADNEFIDESSGRKEKHRVRITRPFYLGIHQVTRGQFRRFVDDAAYRTEGEKDGKGGYGWNDETKQFEQNARFTWRNAGFDQTDEHPVVNVSWNDAQAFIAWLSRKEGETYRLPTEAEWEYACRAGSTTRYSSGDDESALGQYAWYSANSDRRTHPVGEKKPNTFGLHDMHGNVWEWCWDGYDAGYYAKI